MVRLIIQITHHINPMLVSTLMCRTIFQCCENQSLFPTNLKPSSGDVFLLCLEGNQGDQDFKLRLHSFLRGIVSDATEKKAKGDTALRHRDEV